MAYTIVLTPPENQMQKYIDASQKLFGDCKSRYLLSKTSYPHITVVQFKDPSHELARKVWEKTCELLANAHFQPFSLSFDGVSFIKGENGFTWVELAVGRGQKDSPLMKVHGAALVALEHFGLLPGNKSENAYRPHLTLAYCELKPQIPMWPNDLCDNPGEFTLELGMSNEEYQYVTRLERYP